MPTGHLADPARRRKRSTSGSSPAAWGLRRRQEREGVGAVDEGAFRQADGYAGVSGQGVCST
jgi:hypothetical protein